MLHNDCRVATAFRGAGAGTLKVLQFGGYSDRIVFSSKRLIGHLLLLMSLFVGVLQRPKHFSKMDPNYLPQQSSITHPVFFF